MSVQNNPSAVAMALEKGLKIRKLQFVATLADDSDLQLKFALDTSLGVSSLKLPKAETGMEKEADFLLKYEGLSKIAGIWGGLAKS